MATEFNLVYWPEYIQGNLLTDEQLSGGVLPDMGDTVHGRIVCIYAS
jgi:hypothetical protein